MIGFEGKEYPTVSVQGVVLATNLLAVDRIVNIYSFLSIALVLLLFTLQAINSRFFYYFPKNGFIKQMTYDIDTYILYGLTFFAIFFMLAGLFGFLEAIISTVVICGFPFLWRFFGKPRIQDRLVARFRNIPYELNSICPCCGGKLKIYRKIIDKDHATESKKCIGNCKKEWPEKFVPYGIG